MAALRRRVRREGSITRPERVGKERRLAIKWIECFYGQSGTGKSESIAAIIRRIYEETGKIARVAVGDGSWATYEALLEAGVVQMMDYSIRDWPLSTLKQVTEGWWPEDVFDPKSKMQPMTKEQFDKIGVYVIEGLSVGANYIMGDKKGGFAARAALGEKIAGDSPIQLIDHERDANGNIKPNSGPGYAFGGVTLGAYGAAQRRMLGYVEQSKALPGWVIWTAHERASEDRVSNVKLIGPEVAGGALTASLSRVFNNTLHFTTAERSVKEKDEHTGKPVDVIDAEFRVYTRDHFRPEGNTYVKYKAVTRHPDPNGTLYGRGETDALPLYFTSDQPGKSVMDFYDHINAARDRQIATLRKVTEERSKAAA